LIGVNRILPKTQKTPQNSKGRSVGTQQAACRGSTHIRYGYKTFSRHSDLSPGICATMVQLFL